MGYVHSAINVDGIRVDHPLMNAAGTCKDLAKVVGLARSLTSAVMVGSITVEGRIGNPGNVYWAAERYSLNSLGLPNRGAQYYKKTLPEMAKIVHDNGKPIFVSVAGFSPDEYGYLTELAFEGGADMVELNLGCPNVWVGTEQKPIASFVPELVEEILDKVAKVCGPDRRTQRVAIKVSPFSNPMNLIQVAKVVAQKPLVKVVTTSNTFPNAFGFDEICKPRISGTGFAGLAGPAMKEISLGQVRQWRDNLPENVLIFGVGGVTLGHHILEYQECGASMVQVATAYLEGGERIFSQILTELVQMES